MKDKNQGNIMKNIPNNENNKYIDKNRNENQNLNILYQEQNMKNYYGKLNENYLNNKQNNILREKNLQNDKITSQTNYHVLGEYKKDKNNINKVGSMNNNINNQKQRYYSLDKKNINTKNNNYQIENKENYGVNKIQNNSIKNERKNEINYKNNYINIFDRNNNEINFQNKFNNNTSDLITTKMVLNSKEHQKYNNNLQDKNMLDINENSTNLIVNKYLNKKNIQLIENSVYYYNNLNNNNFSNNNINNQINNNSNNNKNFQRENNNFNNKINNNNQINNNIRSFSPPPKSNMLLKNQFNNANNGMNNKNMNNQNKVSPMQNLNLNNMNNNIQNNNNNKNNINPKTFNQGFNNNPFPQNKQFTNNQNFNNLPNNSNSNNMFLNQNNNFINGQNFNNNNLKKPFSPINNNNQVPFNNFNNQGFNLNAKSSPQMMQMNIPINNFLGNNNLINQFQNFLFNPISANINQNQVNKRNKSAPRPKKNLPIINKPFANGLQNIGATCYMNATIQCLAHVEDFTKGLLRKKDEIKKNKYKNKLANAFLEVIENIWENNNIKYYAPYYFKELISKMNPLFEGIQANDSKDLVLFLLETMHNELNKVTVSNQFEDNIDQYNFENSFYSFANYFKNNFRSIVSDIFYGMYNSRMKCYSCGVVTHNIQCYNLLIIPLEEVRIFKNRFQNYVTIRECFEYYQKSDFMTGQNQIYCNNCKQMANSENNTTLLVGPKVLIINLNRGKGLQFNVTIDFNEYINISDFLFFKKPYINYELIGVVTHFGPSSDSGHFIAFCKSFVDKRWYKYNDAIVTPCSFQDTKNTGVPYILFYSAQQ